jgi:hypothetical protein
MKITDNLNLKKVTKVTFGTFSGKKMQVVKYLVFLL